MPLVRSSVTRACQQRRAAEMASPRSPPAGHWHMASPAHFTPAGTATGSLGHIELVDSLDQSRGLGSELHTPAEQLWSLRALVDKLEAELQEAKRHTAKVGETCERLKLEMADMLSQPLEALKEPKLDAGCASLFNSTLESELGVLEGQSVEQLQSFDSWVTKLKGDLLEARVPAGAAASDECSTFDKQHWWEADFGGAPRAAAVAPAALEAEPELADSPHVASDVRLQPAAPVADALGGGGAPRGLLDVEDDPGATEREDAIEAARIARGMSHDFLACYSLML